MESVNKQVSDNELDYVDFILYYRKGVQQSEKLIPFLADNHLEVRIVDVDSIPIKPPWLTGVPTVIINPKTKQDGQFQLLKGRQATLYVTEWVNSKIEANSKKNVQEFDGCPSKKGYACEYSADLFTLAPQDSSQDDKYLDNPKTKLASNSLEDYCRARGQSLPQENE